MTLSRGEDVIRLESFSASVVFKIKRARSEAEVLDILLGAHLALTHRRVTSRRRYLFWRLVEFRLRQYSGRMLYVDAALNDLVAYALLQVKSILENEDEGKQKGES